MAVKYKKRGFKSKQRPGQRSKALVHRTHEPTCYDLEAYRASLIAEIPSLEVKLQTYVKELRGIICSHDPTSVISMVHDAFMLSRWKAGAAYASDDKSMYLGLLLEYLHACYACTEALPTAPHLDEAYFDRLCNLMPGIIETANRLVSAKAAEGLVVDGVEISPAGVAIMQLRPSIGWVFARRDTCH